MPYINKDLRKDIDNHVLEPVTAGELNYLIFKACLKFQGGEHCYHSYNTVIGVLECVKQEFYRRCVVPYEEIKKEENGDVLNDYNIYDN